MNGYGSLSRTRWECKYRIVFVPKCRREVLFGHVKKELGKISVELAGQKEGRIEAGSLQPDHVRTAIT